MSFFEYVEIRNFVIGLASFPATKDDADAFECYVASRNSL
jgi:hypothetical protein